MEMWNDFDNQNNQGSNTPKQTNQGQAENPLQGGTNDIDDFFGASAQPQAQQVQPPNQEVRQASPEPAQNLNNSGSNQGGNYNYFDQENDKDGEFAPGQQMNNPVVMSHLRRIEEERMKTMYQKEQAERAEKVKRIEKAKSELNQWKAERIKNIEQRKKINRENQELLSRNKGESDFKNPWEKIVNNVAIKESEYPGTKDVSAMRMAIINKKSDLATTK